MVLEVPLYKLFQGTKKTDTKTPTFYSLRYKDGIPIIVCNDISIPEKYFILDGSKFSHTEILILLRNNHY